jgi:nucleoside-diphosphate-sugar epimerase
MIESASRAGCERYFFSSSACAYNTDLQKDPKVTALKESDAYPAMAGRGYGWEPRTPLRVGLKNTYDWIKEQFYLRKAGKKTIAE